MHVSRSGLRDFALGFLMFVVGVAVAGIVLFVWFVYAVTR
jgi:hypothetical protein